MGVAVLPSWALLSETQTLTVGFIASEETLYEPLPYLDITPTISSVVGVDGNDYVTFNYNTGIQLSGGDYTDGFTVLINGGATGLNYIQSQSSPSTGQIDFRLTQTPNKPLAEGDTITYSYIGASGSIVSILGNVSAPDQAGITTVTASGFNRAIDFDSGTLGASAARADSIYGYEEYASSATSVFSDTFLDTASTMAVKTTLIEGTAGDSPNLHFGGRFYYGDARTTPLQTDNRVTLGEGEEVWFRISIYYPVAGEEGAPSLGGVPTGEDWQFNTTNAGMKTIRMSIGGTNKYIDLYTERQSAWGGGSFHYVQNEVVLPQTDFYQVHNPRDVANTSGFIRNKVGVEPKIGTGWNTYEVNLKHTAIEGAGHWRIWQEGVLVWEDMVVPTMRSGDEGNFVAHITYWNNKLPNGTFSGAPQTQSCWIDNVKMQESIPSGRDAAGNPMIGPIGWVNP